MNNVYIVFYPRKNTQAEIISIVSSESDAIRVLQETQRYDQQNVWGLQLIDYCCVPFGKN
jgi:hypothetical protein